MNVLDTARFLADNWPQEAMIAPETGLPVCIETTRHVVEAFHQAGVNEVQPLPCALYAFNRPATVQVLRGVDHVDGACRVEVAPESKHLGPKRGWYGHLVIDHPQFLLDLVLPGVIRSTGAHGFEGVGAFCGEKGNELQDVDGAWMALTTDGMCFRYQPRPRLASWRNTDAWRGELDRTVVRTLTAQIKGLLAHEGSPAPAG